MNKRLKCAIAAIACVSACSLQLIGCGRGSGKGSAGGGGGGGSNIGEITLWVPNEQADVYNNLVNSFLYTHKTGNVKINAMSAGKVYEQLSLNPEAGADVFMFTGEYVNEMKNDGLLYKTNEHYANLVRARDESFAVQPIDGNDGICAFPAALDNGWIFWYNSEFYSDSEVQSLDVILQRAQAARKKVRFMYSSFWYAASFFKGVGCELDYNGNGYYYTDIDGQKGITAARAMYKYGSYADTIVEYYDAATINGMFSGDVVAAFGPATMGDGFTDNVFPAICPQFATDDGSGSTARMQPYVDGKYFGINPNCKYKDFALELANYLSDQSAQTHMYEEFFTLPSNKNLLNSIETTDAVARVMRDQYQTSAAHLYRHSESAYSEIARIAADCFERRVDLPELNYMLQASADLLNE